MAMGTNVDEQVQFQIKTSNAGNEFLFIVDTFHFEVIKGSSLQDLNSMCKLTN